ncbi:hypothetical protein SBA4_1120010 [Candidatus Sulfopaludibacter sp. SbA4]|nr:hypothetical protein SBA4_1120010 [Candidatus Sulfopaludibacter sp. SbA4]
MPLPRSYATAEAFRRALEERLKRTSVADRIDLNALRRRVSFDRLLARLFREETVPWVLKGGYDTGVAVYGCSIHGGHSPDGAASRVRQGSGC